jgi:hypothetical protein
MCITGGSGLFGTISFDFLGAPAGDLYLCSCMTAFEMDEQVDGAIMGYVKKFVAFVVLIVAVSSVPRFSSAVIAHSADFSG